MHADQIRKRLLDEIAYCEQVMAKARRQRLRARRQPAAWSDWHELLERFGERARALASLPDPSTWPLATEILLSKGRLRELTPFRLTQGGRRG